LRLSIGGGSTDLASYYRRFGGFAISAAINKYVYIGINRTFTDEYFLKYSALERVGSIAEIKHPLIREALRLHSVGPAVEIVSLADIPAGTGLGSSGAFTVGLLRAIYALRRDHASAATVAEEACHIEIDVLGEAVGKRDPYIAAFGGLTCFEFPPEGRVKVTPLKLSGETLNELEENLLMFFTGSSRSASAFLADQKARTEQGDAEMLENLHAVKDLGYRIKDALEAGRTREFAALLDQHWMYKKSRSGDLSNDTINRWYDAAMANGALGGKLVGAGGGGFLLFFAEDRVALRRAMAQEGLAEVRFQFDHDGSAVIVRG